MSKARPRLAWSRSELPDVIEGDLTQCDNDANPRKQLHFAHQERSAVGDFRWEGFVERRGAMQYGSDVAVAQSEPVVSVDRERLVGETEPVQCPVEPITTSVSREDPARAGSTMRSGRQSNHQQTGTIPPKAWNGPSPILDISESCDFGFRNCSGPGDQTRAAPADAHRLLQGFYGWRSLWKVLHVLVAGKLAGKRKALKPMVSGLVVSLSAVRLAFLARDFLSLEPFGALDDGELDRLSLFERAIPFGLNRRVVNEDITTRRPLDEAITFGVVEPLHSSTLSTH